MRVLFTKKDYFSKSNDHTVIVFTNGITLLRVMWLVTIGLTKQGNIALPILTVHFCKFGFTVGTNN